MAKKKTPKKIFSEFGNRLMTAVDHHKELLLAVHLKKHQAALEAMLAEQFVFYIVVLWEVFLNDLLIAYLVASPKRFAASLKEKIITSAKDRYGTAASEAIRFSLPRILTFAQRFG